MELDNVDGRTILHKYCDALVSLCLADSKALEQLSVVIKKKIKLAILGKFNIGYRKFYINEKHLGLNFH